jgi:two-component system NarL family sensor kinase
MIRKRYNGVFMHLLFSIVCCMALLPDSRAAGSDTSAIKAMFIHAMEIQDYDPDSALLLAKEGYLLSQQAHYPAGLGMAFMRFASIMNTTGHNDSALIYYREALQIRKQLNDRSGIAGTCRQISYVYRDLGKKDSSFYYLYEALRYYTQPDDRSGTAIIYVELADLHIAYKEYAAAETYLEKARPIFEQYRDTIHIYQVLTEYGILNFSLGKYTEALRYFFKAAALNHSMNNPIFYAKELNYMGLCYQELANFPLAKKYFREAISRYEALDMPNDLALGYFNLGNLFIDLKQADSAIAFLKKGLTIAQETEDLQRVSRCMELLSDAYVLKGNYLQAYQYHVQYSALNDSLLNLEKVKQIAMMKAIYQDEKKEQTIHLLGEQTKTRVAERNFFIAGSMVLLLGLFVLGFYYIQKNRLASKNEELARQRISSLLSEQEIRSYNAMIDGQEEERRRIATDLHDRLGSMLSTIKLLFNSMDVKIDQLQKDSNIQYHKANALLDEACAEVRIISHNLSTGMVSSFGLTPALEELCESINDSKLIRCKLMIAGTHERLELQAEITIYRMIQEIFNNILKHAHASQISLQLNQDDEMFRITIEDNGSGFDVEEKQNSGGMGLRNLEARAAKLNGSFHIDSRPGRGAIAIIEIPRYKQES